MTIEQYKQATPIVRAYEVVSDLLTGIKRTSTLTLNSNSVTMTLNSPTCYSDEAYKVFYNNLLGTIETYKQSLEEQLEKL